MSGIRLLSPALFTLHNFSLFSSLFENEKGGQNSEILSERFLWISPCSAVTVFFSFFQISNLDLFRSFFVDFSNLFAWSCS